MSDPTLTALAGELRSRPGLLADAATGPDSDAPAEHADGAIGPRTAEHPDDYRLLVEAIAEGHRLHYGDGRVVRTDDDDLALLAGDHLYALGLSRLAELGDLEAVVALADVISGCARAHAEGRPDDVAAAWRRGLAVVSGGA